MEVGAVMEVMEVLEVVGSVCFPIKIVALLLLVMMLCLPETDW